MILHTDRLILRPWKEEDASWLYEYAKDKDVGPRAGWNIHTSIENSKQIINTVLSSPLTYAIVLKEVDHVIGSIGLMVGEESNINISRNEAEIGYWIGKPFWGCGITKEACDEIIRYGFENLELDTLWCGYFDENIQSKRVQEKCGFQYHHTNENVYWPLIDEYKIEHITCMPKSVYKENVK